MTIAEKNIINSYFSLLEGLSTTTKAELIEKLTKSMKVKEKQKDKLFFASFGAFESDKSAEEIIQDIKSSRTFRNKEICFA